MGIHNLNQFLRKKCPQVFEEIHLSQYAYKKLAIDISLFLCKFKSICGEKWVAAFINLISSLRRNEIHCVFIYDNGAPVEKTAERAERRKQQDNMRKKVFDLEESVENYKKNKIIDELLSEVHAKVKTEGSQRLLSGGSVNFFDIVLVEEYVKKKKNQILNICEEDFILTRELFDILNVPYYIAPLEAECACADLCKRGIVDAVLTEDTDVLAYGSPIFLSKIDTSSDTCVQIKYYEVLEALGLNGEEFLDLCIMFGCDYNKNINKVGVETAFKYLTKYRSIDNIEKELNLDVSVLNHRKSRELFTEYKKLEIESIPFCGAPHFENLQNFISRHKLFGINFDKIKSHFTENNVVIMGSDNEDNEDGDEEVVNEDEDDEEVFMNEENGAVQFEVEEDKETEEQVNEAKAEEPIEDEYDFEIVIEDE